MNDVSAAEATPPPTTGPAPRARRPVALGGWDGCGGPTIFPPEGGLLLKQPSRSWLGATPPGVVVNTRSLSAFLLAPLFAGLLAAPETSSAATRCQQVNARLSFELVECTEGIGLCLEGTVSGGGLLHGTLRGVILELVTNAGLSDPGVGLNSYSADVTFTTATGTVTVRDIGLLEAVTETDGLFSSIAVPRTATGRLEGISGHLFSRGLIDGTSFDGNLSGELCLGE